MAARKKPAKGTKAAFIRANPNLTPAEMAEKAKKQGLVLSIQHIYAARSADKAKAKVKPSKKKRAHKKRQTASVEPTIKPQASNGARSIGYLISTATEALEEIKRRLSQVSL